MCLISTYFVYIFCLFYFSYGIVNGNEILVSDYHIASSPLNLKSCPGDKPIGCRGLLCQFQLSKRAAKVFGHAIKLFLYYLKSKGDPYKLSQKQRCILELEEFSLFLPNLNLNSKKQNR